MITSLEVVNSSKCQLLCIVYDGLIDNINKIKKSKNNNKQLINHSIDIIQSLVNDLDFKYELSRDLFKLYMYVQKSLIVCDINSLDVSIQIISGLRESYNRIDTVNDKKPVIYSGMTYGRSSLNDSLTGSSSRDFKA